MTGRDLVSASLRLIGAIAPGESPQAQEYTDGLASINRMIDSWSNENLMVYAVTRESSITLTPGTAIYTLGAGGNITTRPGEIEHAMIQDASTNVEYPIMLVSASEFAEITLKTIQSNYPTALYDDGGYPQRTVTLYPTPSAANKLNLYTLRPITTIATLDTSLSLPPGYERALVYNGALELAPEYGRQATDLVVKAAMESKEVIKRRNHRSMYLRIDDIPSDKAVGFDIRTGGYRR